MPDLNAREWAAVLPLVVLMIWMGMYSQSFLPSIGASNAKILTMIERRTEQQVKKTVPAPVLEAQRAD